MLLVTSGDHKMIPRFLRVYHHFIIIQDIPRLLKRRFSKLICVLNCNLLGRHLFAALVGEAAVCPSLRPAGAPAGARQQLIDSVFHALNRSASGQLSAAEMRPFAEKTGAFAGHSWTAYNCYGRSHGPFTDYI